MLGILHTELKVLFFVCTEGVRISSPKVDGVTILVGISIMDHGVQGHSEQDLLHYW